MSKIEVNAIEPQSGTTLTLGASGDTVTLAAGASQSGFGRSGSVNWDTTPKTTGFTAVSGNGYFCDTTSAAFTVTLPATPAAGDIVAIADYANTAATNNITVGRNSSKIDGETINGKIKINGQVYTLVYVDAIEGWKTVGQTYNQISTALFVTATGGTVLTCGDYKTHVFTGPGSFVVSCAGNSVGSNSVEYLVIAGGGAGGNGGTSTGGGGAGGYRQNYPSPTTTGLPVTATTYSITVGAGGADVAPTGRGGSGNDSIFSTITSAGGGGGGARANPTANTPGVNGGSGGGSANGSPGVGTGGTGNTPPVSPPQGNPGGNQSPNAGPNYTGGGGGGAGAAGGNGDPANIISGNGGVGSPIATAFFGPTAPSYGTPGPAPGRYFAGGGGSQNYGANPGGAGGAGGGGAGGTGSSPFNPGTSGTTNTGGGGGGAEGSTPGAFAGDGGSGIVVIRYKYQ